MAEITSETVSVSKFWSCTSDYCFSKRITSCLCVCVCIGVHVAVPVTPTSIHLSVLKIVFIPGEHSGGQTDLVTVRAFAWGRWSGDHSTVAKCSDWGNRILSDPPGEAGKVFLKEVMPTLRSEGGVGLARQSEQGREGRGPPGRRRE